MPLHLHSDRPESPLLYTQLAEALRIKNYAWSTEQSYVDWVVRFIKFHQPRHPATLGIEHIRAFIAHLATERQVAPSTMGVGRLRCMGMRCPRSSVTTWIS